MSQAGSERVATPSKVASGEWRHRRGPTDGQREQFLLASASPRRRALLVQAGYYFAVASADVDESRQGGESPEDYVQRLALAKALAGCRLRRAEPSGALGADTAVMIDGEVLGKPRDRADGLAMLASLSGREHVVLSAVAFCSSSVSDVALQRSRVRFREIDEHECAAYWATGEPLDKAGGYAIQGLAAAFVAHLDGSYSGVMGLPLFETTQLLARYGIVACRPVGVVAR